MNALLQTIGAVAGLAAIFVALINVFATRKNRGAEVRSMDATATGALTGAASQLVRDLAEDNNRLRASNDAIETKNDELEGRVRQLEMYMQEQTDWIIAAVRASRAAIPPFSLPDPPRTHQL